MPKLDENMSNIRTKSYLKKDESFANILYHLFRAFGDKDHAVHGWGQKIRGYGIKQSRFQKFNKTKYPINERIFREHKKELVDRRFIEVFDKSNRVRGGPYYTITLLGLFYLLSKLKIYEKNTVNDVFKILDSYKLDDKKMKFDFKLLNHFTTDEIHKAMKQLTHFSEFIFGVDDTVISLDLFIFPSKNRLRVFQARINSDQIQLEKEVWTDLNKDSPFIDKKRFYWLFSLYFTMLLCYYLFKNMKDHKAAQKTPYPFQQNLGIVSHAIETELSRDISENLVEMAEAFDWRKI